MPLLKILNLALNHIGAAGMQALASAFAGGAFRKLESLASAATSTLNPPRASRTATPAGSLPTTNQPRREGIKALMARLPWAAREG